jgi:hypothetical protein
LLLHTPDNISAYFRRLYGVLPFLILGSQPRIRRNTRTSSRFVWFASFEADEVFIAGDWMIFPTCIPKLLCHVSSVLRFNKEHGSMAIHTASPRHYRKAEVRRQNVECLAPRPRNGYSRLAARRQTAPNISPLFPTAALCRDAATKTSMRIVADVPGITPLEWRAVQKSPFSSLIQCNPGYSSLLPPGGGGMWTKKASVGGFNTSRRG